MKKLFIVPLVFSAGLAMTACGGVSNDEAVREEMIQKASSSTLDKIIKEKQATTEDVSTAEEKDAVVPAVDVDAEPVPEEEPQKEAVEPEREA